MVDLEELRGWITVNPEDGAREAVVNEKTFLAMLAELTHLRAKAAAGAKLREALPIRARHPCSSCSVDYILDDMNDAADEYDAAVSEGGTR